MSRAEVGDSVQSDGIRGTVIAVNGRQLYVQWLHPRARTLVPNRDALPPGMEDEDERLDDVPTVEAAAEACCHRPAPNAGNDDDADRSAGTGAAGGWVQHQQDAGRDSDGGPGVRQDHEQDAGAAAAGDAAPGAVAPDPAERRSAVPGARVWSGTGRPGPPMMRMPPWPHQLRVQQRRSVRLPDGAVSVARPTRWGNPFRVERYGRDLALQLYSNALLGVWEPGLLSTVVEATVAEVEQARQLQQEWRARFGVPPKELARLMLTGKRLACYCPLTVPCHADLLAWAAGTRTRPGNGGSR